MNIKWLPAIRPTVFQFGKIDCGVKSNGFWRKKTDSEYFKNAQQHGIGNLFISKIGVYEKTQEKLDALRAMEEVVAEVEEEDDDQ